MSDITRYIDKYFDDRPQFKRPKQNILGYEFPNGDWVHLIEHAIQENDKLKQANAELKAEVVRLGKITVTGRLDVEKLRDALYKVFFKDLPKKDWNKVLMCRIAETCEDLAESDCIILEEYSS